MVSANLQELSEVVVSTLIKGIGDSRMIEELFQAILDNDVDFIKVHVLVSLYPLSLLCYHDKYYKC